MSKSLKCRIRTLEETRLKGQVYVMKTTMWSDILYWSLYEGEIEPKHRATGLIGPFPTIRAANQWALSDAPKNDVQWLLENRSLEDVLADKYLCIHLNHGTYPPQANEENRDAIQG